jgi:hypothetical protein
VFLLFGIGWDPAYITHKEPLEDGNISVVFVQLALTENPMSREDDSSSYTKNKSNMTVIAVDQEQLRRSDVEYALNNPHPQHRPYLIGCTCMNQPCRHYILGMTTKSSLHPMNISL